MARMLFVLCLCGSLGLIVSPSLAENIALGLPYTFSREPNYGLCKDAGDNVQLTDGVKGVCDWTSKSTVGWQRLGGAVSITVDLADVKAISGVSYRTACGGSVGLPAFIVVWVSDDGREYNYAGELISASWENIVVQEGDTSLLQPIGVYRYETRDWKLRGKFVRFTVWAGGGYTFCDEIEVFGGDFAADEVERGSVTALDCEAWVKEYKPYFIAKVRMVLDLLKLKEDPGAARFTGDIDRLRREVLEMPFLRELNMADGLPYTPLHERIWELNGKIQLAGTQRAFTVWPANRYNALHPFDTPVSESRVCEMHLIANEYRSAAINVSNSSDTTEQVEVALEFSGEAWADAESKLRVVRYTEAQERVILANALIDAERVGRNRWRVSLVAGVTSQLWLTLNSRDIDRGQYSALVKVIADDRIVALPVEIVVHAGVMPDAPSLASWTYDYLANPSNPAYESITEKNSAAGIELMHEYRINTFSVTAQSMPGYADAGVAGSSRDRNEDGTLKRPMTFAVFDDCLAAIEGSERYYLNIHYTRSDYYRSVYSGGFSPGTAEYRTAIKSYFTALAEHIESMGLDKKRFMICPYDEPGGNADWSSLTADFIRIAKEAEPEFVFFENPAYDSFSALTDDIYGLMDVTDFLSPYMAWLSRDKKLLEVYQRAAQSGGKVLAGYNCGDGGWLRGPNEYFRKMAWQAWEYGMKGIGVWCFMNAHTQLDAWDDFSGNQSFHIVYFTPESVTPSKTIEAWREGIEDYECFCILKSLVEQCEAANGDESLVRRGRLLLDDLAGRTTSDIPLHSKWRRDPKMTDVHDFFDVARLQLLECIDEITDAMAN